MNVVFIVFNRPDLTQSTFERIRQARPERLFVVSDGARLDRPGEAEKVQQSRAITDHIDWPCEVHRNYSETNMGCGLRVSSGISWAFEFVEELIILEDDCLPDPTFFTFCTELLERYRDDQRVAMIGGSNLQAGHVHGEASYYFSKYAHIWGWATWRRSWKDFDFRIPYWPEVKARNGLSKVCPNRRERQFWTGIFDGVYSGKTDAWSYPWTLNIWMRGDLVIVPNSNLISNTGFRSDATHTLQSCELAEIELKPIEELKHPVRVEQCVAADRYMMRYFMPPDRNILRRLVRKIASTWKRARGARSNSAR